MKHLLTILSFALVFSAFACPAFADSKVLVVVFSRADENYSVGYIKTGNTKIIADFIAESTGADVFEIVPVKAYPADYNSAIAVAKKELGDNARPEIKSDIDISKYDTIFLGYPIWWGDLPMPVYTFIEAHDFANKRVIPFCTHEGSGVSGTDAKLKGILKNATVEKAFALRGATAQNARDAAKQSVNNWLKTLNFK